MPVAPDVAFDLSLSIDLHLDAFAHTKEEAVGGVGSGTIGHGEFVTWRARHFGITWTMTSIISEWDRPRRFVDEQQRGPFAHFRHEHVFTPVDGGTHLHDRVDFAAPFGILGRLAEKLVLTSYLQRLIDVRNTFLVNEATKIGASRAEGERHG